MRTIQVTLTQTTEEMIWTHIEKQMVNLESTIEMFRRDLNALTDEYFHTNPYDKYTVRDWRNNRPTQKYKLNRLRWLEDNGEEYAKEYFGMLDIINDIRICHRAFPEWNDRLCDIMQVIDFTKFDTDELVAYESIKYYQSKEKYEKEDAEFIKERRSLSDHREVHISREKFKTDEYSRNILCYGKEPAYWTTCKWCIQYEQQQKDIKDCEAEQDRIIQEEMKRYEEEQRKKQKEIVETEKYECKCCDYKTRNGDAYDRHMDSKEHKVKQNHADWFCKCCSTQSRSKNEHEFHLKSAKHQKNVNGELESEIKMFRCECCDYDTPRKDYYKLHLTSKKHAKNSSE
jgi:hypothetical protein